MKKMKKIFAMLLAFTMVLGMTMTASAETVTKPLASDDTAVTVKNVEAKVSEGKNTVNVTAYQVIDAKYNDYGFLGYVDVADIDNTKSDLGLVAGTYMVESERLTSDQVTKIAKDIIENNVTLASVPLTTAATEGLATYTADLTAGYWIVLVSGTVDEVYNPMLVGVYYDVETETGSNGTVTTKPVDANTKWSLTTTNAYAKSTAPTFNKSIVDKDGNINKDGNDNGQNAAYGDKIYFKLDNMKIPSYSKEYTEVTLKIADTLSGGLTLNKDSITITVGDAPLAASNYTLVTDDQSFTITIHSDYVLKVDNTTNLLENADKNIVVTYSASVDENAPYNFDENSNTAKLIYSNDPTNKDNVKEVEDKTYVYTFGIDGRLNGEKSKITKELFKVDENGKVTVSEKEVTVTSPLEGATFTLTRTDAPANFTGKTVYTATSDKNGALKYTGLDAGTYTLVETAAPTGYSINAEPHTVVISAEYNEDGTLASYTVTIDGEATSTYTATYDSTTKEITTIDKTAIGAVGITNTKLINLPSTGGIGTTIFTIAGCGIMIAAAFFFFASRKKEN